MVLNMQISFSEALNTVKQYCENNIGGKLVGEYSEWSLNLVITCLTDLSIDTLARAIRDIPLIHNYIIALSKDFNPKFEVRDLVNDIYLIYEAGFKTLSIYISKIYEYKDIDVNTVEYVYPDPCEDEYNDNNVNITIKSGGLKYAFKEYKKLKAYARGVLHFKKDIEEYTVSEIKHYIYILNSLISEEFIYPQNFFSFKS